VGNEDGGKEKDRGKNSKRAEAGIGGNTNNGEDFKAVNKDNFFKPKATDPRKGRIEGLEGREKKVNIISGVKVGEEVLIGVVVPKENGKSS